MKNPYSTKTAIVKRIRNEAREVKSFVLDIPRETLTFIPGQFIVASLPGFGESVFVPAETFENDTDFEISVHKIGRVTEAMHRLKKGDRIGIRGPYGNGFEVEKIRKNKDILMVAGGLGIIPLRALFRHLTKKYCELYPAKIQLFYGARSYDMLLFKKEYRQWQKCLDLEVTLGKPYPDTVRGWKAHAGIITTIFKKVAVVKPGTSILCGPPIMFKFVLPKIKTLGVLDENIYLSLERKMDCAGLGTCQHCGIGKKYVCKDGPVFLWQELKDLPQAF